MTQFKTKEQAALALCKRKGYFITDKVKCPCISKAIPYHMHFSSTIVTCLECLSVISYLVDFKVFGGAWKWQK